MVDTADKFAKILAGVHRQTGIRTAAYCLMLNHWHLLLWPTERGLTRDTLFIHAKSVRSLVIIFSQEHHKSDELLFRI
jgi:REP element-mobilizing transposase RayT